MPGQRAEVMLRASRRQHVFTDSTDAPSTRMEAASSNKETTTSLEDLPDEVLFVIIEQGTLGTLDGFAIRWVGPVRISLTRCVS